MKKLLFSKFIILFLFLGACNNNENEAVMSPNSTTAKYKVTFNATWSSTTHPTDFPSNANPHFSSLVGMTHNDQVKLFEQGTLATTGIKNMAETGSTSALRNEIEVWINGSTAGVVISGTPTSSSPDQATAEFTITQQYPLASLVTMIAPSPDWFVGVSGVNLFENGAWVSSKTIEVGTYDSGTDSGPTYRSANEVTSPQENIMKITTAPLATNGKVENMGTITFERIE